MYARRMILRYTQFSYPILFNSILILTEPYLSDMDVFKTIILL